MHVQGIVFKIMVSCRFGQHPNLTQTAAHAFLLEHVVKPPSQVYADRFKKWLRGVDGPLSSVELMLLLSF